MDGTQPMVFSANEATDIGDESGTTATADYPAFGSRFTGRLHWVQLDTPAPTTTTTSSAP